MKKNADRALRKMPVPALPDTGMDIGGTLSSARAKKGQTLESASRQTRIPKRLLEALEANRFEEFAGSAYLRGFLKSYCDFLEMDFDALWKEAFPPANPAAPAPAPAAGPAPKAAAIPAAEPARAHAHAPAPSHAHRIGAEKPARRAPWLALGAAALVPLLLIWYSSAKKTAPKDAAYVPAPLKPIDLSMEFRTSIDFKSSCWAFVSVDGEAKFEGRVPQGSHQEWKARREVTVKTSQPDALSVKVNGAPYRLSSTQTEFRIESP